MKFFTAELLSRFGSTDEATADAAHQDWEKANRKYLKHLKGIRPQLPRGARTFLRNPCLHDARLLALGTRNDCLTLLLERASLGVQGVLLTYALAKRPELLKHPDLVEPGTPTEWMYDEFDAVRNGPEPLFTHSILFTGGQELGLTFRKLRAVVFEKVLTPTAEGSESDLDALLVDG